MHTVLKALCLLFLLFALGLPGATYAQDPNRADCASAGLKSCKPLNDFVARLRSAMKANDRNAVAAMVTYPIEIQVKSGLEIKNKQAFVKHYDEIVTDAVRKALAQDPFVNPRKIIQFVGEKAQVWLEVDNGRLLIGSIIMD